MLRADRWDCVSPDAQVRWRVARRTRPSRRNRRIRAVGRERRGCESQRHLASLEATHERQEILSQYALDASYRKRSAGVENVVGGRSTYLKDAADVGSSENGRYRLDGVWVCGSVWLRRKGQLMASLGGSEVLSGYAAGRRSS